MPDRDRISMRLVSLLLLAALLLLFGCDNTKPTPADDTTVSDDTTAAPDDTTFFDDVSYEPLDLPAGLNFGGEPVRILARHGASAGAYASIFNDELLVEELNNNVINDSIFNRQQNVEDLLGVELKLVTAASGEGFNQYLDRMMIAGDQDCEIVAIDAMASVASAIKGYNINMLDVPYVDLNRPWWYQTFTEHASIADGLFFINGDLSLTTLRQSYVVAYNKTFAQDRGIDDLYDLVFGGTWTLDTMMNKIDGLYMDLNGNSEIDPEDRFGMIADYCFADSYWVSFDIPVFSKDEDNHLVFSLNRDKYGTAFDKTMRLFKSIDTNMDSDTPLVEFASGSSLFYGMELSDTETAAMRNMQDVYGILPVPKYDEEQSGYYTMPHDTHTVFFVPANVKSPELAGAVLDAFGWYSYRYVTPAYLDIALKGQYANDPETRRILDIVTDGISFESAWIFSFQLSGIAQCWRYLIVEEDNGWAQDLASKERKIRVLIGELNDNFDQLCE